MEDLAAYLHFVVLPQVIDALIIGVALALVALGLTMIFGLLDVINLAHGELYISAAMRPSRCSAGAPATGARSCWCRCWSGWSAGRSKNSASVHCCRGRIARS